MNLYFTTWKQLGIRHLLLGQEKREEIQSLLAQKILQKKEIPQANNSDRKQNIQAKKIIPPTEHHQENIPKKAQEKAFIAKSPAKKIAQEKIVEAWPKIWQSRFEQSPRRPLIMWSYAALQDDFCGRRDDGRAEVVKSLYTNLALPQGSHVLWPLRLDGDEAERSDIFLEALRLFHPRLVVFLYNEPPKRLNVSGLHRHCISHPPALSSFPSLLSFSMEELVENRGQIGLLVDIVKAHLKNY